MSPQTATITKRERHGMLPESVVLDLNLSAMAVRLYSNLAINGHGAMEVEMCHADMMKDLGISKATTKRCLGELVERSHIIANRRHNKFNVYTLTSSVFANGAVLLPVKTNEAQAAPSSPKVLLSDCPKCHKLSRLTRSGWCRGCNKDAALKLHAERIRVKFPDIGEQDLLKMIMEENGLRRMTPRLRRACFLFPEITAKKKTS